MELIYIKYSETLSLIKDRILQWDQKNAQVLWLTLPPDGSGKGSGVTQDVVVTGC